MKKVALPIITAFLFFISVATVPAVAEGDVTCAQTKKKAKKVLTINQQIAKMLTFGEFENRYAGTVTLVYNVENGHIVVTTVDGENTKLNNLVNRKVNGKPVDITGHQGSLDDLQLTLIFKPRS